jgi:hypothetical protein
MKHYRRGSIALALWVISAGGCSLVSPPPPNPWHDWIPLENPRDTVPLGDAWDPNGGSFYSGCAQRSSNTVHSNGPTSYVISWQSSANADAALKVADRLGFGATAQQARSGKIQIDSTIISTATDLLPASVGCSRVALDGFPALPIIHELLGARHITIQMTDSSGASLNADAAEEVRGSAVGAGGHVTTQSDSRIDIEYQQPVYVGMHLEGYALEGGDTTWTETTRMGQAVDVGANWQIVVSPFAIDSTRYLARSTYNGPGGGVFEDTVSHRESFPFGRAGSSLQAGAFTIATLDVQGGAQNYRLRVIRQRIVPCPFQDTTDRADLARWISERRTGPASCRAPGRNDRR